MGIYAVPSQRELLKLLDYNPQTGALIWRRRDDANFNSKHAGKAAGSLTAGRSDKSNKYLQVGIKTDRYRQYQAHRLIWMIMTGKQPPPAIDHRDGDELNLKWENLRAATNGQNLQNSKLRKDNVSGIKGVSWDAGHKKWRATISVDRQHIRLGRFNTVAEAANIINAERIRLHGEFARLK